MISIIIINYNTKGLLKPCMESLLAQDQKDREIIFIDNNSTDGSCPYMQANFPDIINVCNSNNTGYTGAANQGIKMAKGEFIMIMNADIKFETDYISKCLAKMKEDKKIAAICGKVYKYDFENDKKTNFIDTAGLFCFRNRRIIDDGQGLEDKGQFDREQEVFGISGACPIYRRSALEDTKIGDEYLDNDFFMYKEDVDISWRMNLFGWKCYYFPKAVAHHGRGTGVLKRFTHHEVLKNRSKLNKLQKYYSYKNQRLMQIKNEFIGGFFKDFFDIIWKEILVFLYMVLREPFLFKAWLEMISQIPAALKKRRYIMSHRKISSRDMDKWLRGKQSKYLKYDLEHSDENGSSQH